MLKKICGLLSGIVLIILLATAVILVVPNLIGWKTMSVLSGSMEPELPVGAVVWVKPVDAEALKVGDVISYHMNSNTMVTHRITEIDTENRQFITKGDANESEDGSPVPFSEVVGKAVFHVAYLGYISIYIKTPLGIAGICGILILLILLNAVPDITEKAHEDKG